MEKEKSSVNKLLVVLLVSFGTPEGSNSYNGNNSFIYRNHERLNLRKYKINLAQYNCFLLF